MLYYNIEFPLDKSRWPVLICLFGRFRIFKAGEHVLLHNASKTKSLLISLALAKNRPIPRDTLLQTLWPDTATNLASQALSSLIHGLRDLLKDKIGDQSPVISLDGSYQLNFDAGIGVDMYWFETLASTGEQQEHSGRLAAAIDTYKMAINIYEGDLCEIRDSQALMVAESLRAHYLTLLSRLADFYYEQHELSKCLEYTNQLLVYDPCREDAHRLVMRCYVKQGNRSQALRQYQICKQILQAEFDTEPEAVSTELYERIRSAPDTL
jgi:DNA-binding SARP family transcriptional activator